MSKSKWKAHHDSLNNIAAFLAKKGGLNNLGAAGYLEQIAKDISKQFKLKAPTPKK